MRCFLAFSLHTSLKCYWIQNGEKLNSSHHLFIYQMALRAEAFCSQGISPLGWKFWDLQGVVIGWTTCAASSTFWHRFLSRFLHFWPSSLLGLNKQHRIAQAPGLLALKWEMWMEFLVPDSWLQPLPVLAVEDILEKETECNLSVSLSLYISILFQINKIIKNCNSWERHLEALNKMTGQES